MSGLRTALGDLPDAVFADLLERDDAYRLVLDLPDVTTAGLDLEVRAGRLAIEARREKPVPAGYSYVREGRDLFFDADLPLPADASAAGADASLDRGVLEVTLPKRSAVTGTDVEVSDA